jgi:hypothetical protein
MPDPDRAKGFPREPKPVRAEPIVDLDQSNHFGALRAENSIHHSLDMSDEIRRIIDLRRNFHLFSRPTPAVPANQ